MIINHKSYSFRRSVLTEKKKHSFPLIIFGNAYFNRNGHIYLDDFNMPERLYIVNVMPVGDFVPLNRVIGTAEITKRRDGYYAENIRMKEGSELFLKMLLRGELRIKISGTGNVGNDLVVANYIPTCLYLSSQIPTNKFVGLLVVNL